MKIDIVTMYQACNLCDALLRNINENFKSVSFEILDNDDIQIKIILEKRSQAEDDYISDMIAEFVSKQSTDCVKKPLIETEGGSFCLPLQNIVYQKHV